MGNKVECCAGARDFLPFFKLGEGQDHKIYIHGYLYKQPGNMAGKNPDEVDGGLFDAWRKRYFVFNRNSVSYWQNEEAYKKKETPKYTLQVADDKFNIRELPPLTVPVVVAAPTESPGDASAEIVPGAAVPESNEKEAQPPQKKEEIQEESVGKTGLKGGKKSDSDDDEDDETEKKKAKKKKDKKKKKKKDESSSSESSLSEEEEEEEETKSETKSADAKAEPAPSVEATSNPAAPTEVKTDVVVKVAATGIETTVLETPQQVPTTTTSPDANEDPTQKLTKEEKRALMFEIVSTERVILVKAESAAVKESWFKAMQEFIADMRALKEKFDHEKKKAEEEKNKEQVEKAPNPKATVSWPSEVSKNSAEPSNIDSLRSNLQRRPSSATLIVEPVTLTDEKYLALPLDVQKVAVQVLTTEKEFATLSERQLVSGRGKEIHKFLKELRPQLAHFLTHDPNNQALKELVAKYNQLKIDVPVRVNEAIERHNSKARAASTLSLTT